MKTPPFDRLGAVSRGRISSMLPGQASGFGFPHWSSREAESSMHLVLTGLAARVEQQSRKKLGRAVPRFFRVNFPGIGGTKSASAVRRPHRHEIVGAEVRDNTIMLVGDDRIDHHFRGLDPDGVLCGGLRSSGGLCAHPKCKGEHKDGP